jgi:hypothetical protein
MNNIRRCEILGFDGRDFWRHVDLSVDAEVSQKNTCVSLEGNPG